MVRSFSVNQLSRILSTVDKLTYITAGSKSGEERGRVLGRAGAGVGVEFIEHCRQKYK